MHREDVIRRRYERGIRYFFDTYCPICDRWVLADNSESPFVVVAEGNKTDKYIKDQKKFDRIYAIAYPEEEKTEDL